MVPEAMPCHLTDPVDLSFWHWANLPRSPSIAAAGVEKVIVLSVAITPMHIANFDIRFWLVN